MRRHQRQPAPCPCPHGTPDHLPCLECALDLYAHEWEIWAYSDEPCPEPPMPPEYRAPASRESLC